MSADLIAALGLVLVFEGLALAIFARSLPELMASLSEIDGDGLRFGGLVAVGLGLITYLLARGALTL